MAWEKDWYGNVETLSDALGLDHLIERVVMYRHALWQIRRAALRTTCHVALYKKLCSGVVKHIVDLVPDSEYQ